MKSMRFAVIWFAILCSCTTGIHGAAKYQKLDKLERHVAEGRINERNGKGETPLILAAYYGYADIVKYLCEQGAEVDVQDNTGTTALIYSVRFRFEAVTRLLVQHGASIDFKDDKGHEALHYARIHRYYRMVDFLESIAVKNRQEKPLTH